MMNITQTAQALITLGQYYWSEKRAKSLRSNPTPLLHSIQKELSDLELSIDEVKIIAAIFYRILREERGISALEVLGDVFKEATDKLANMDLIRNLIFKNILEPSEKRYSIRDDKSRKIELIVNRFNILTMDLSLSQKFIARILGENESEIGTEEAPYRDNKEYISDWFAYIEQLRDYRNGLMCGCPEEMSLEKLADVARWEKRIEIRSARTRQNFPFQELIQDYSLDKNEQALLIYMLKEELDGDFCSKDELLNLISEDKFEQFKNSKYFSRESRLARHGLIEMEEYMMFNSRGSDIRLAPDTMARIMHATPKTDDERIREIIRHNDIMTLTNPAQDFERLILAPEIKKNLTTAIAQAENKVGARLHKWGFDSGIYHKSAGKNAAYKPAMLLLFYGPPGTGKTFAAGAVAKTLGKKLLTTDISRVLNCYVGESEKNVRQIFSQYEKISLRTSNPPVLLLNECDQFLGSRGKSEGSVERMYNQMQNLFLEAFERFQGVLIATTNLVDNLDSAFSRRFTLKLEFPVPGVEERKKLWKIHLPDNLPLSGDIEIDKLAKTFTLTGGQIALVVKNAAVEAAQKPKRQRRLAQALLEKYARLESQTAFGSDKIKKMGFGK